MSANLAISLAAQAQANVAQAEATAAHRTACSALMEGYQHSVEFMHEYVSCVNLRYPDTTDYFWLKVALWVIIAFATSGAVAGWYKNRNGICGFFIGDVIMSGIGGALAGALFVGLAALVVWSF